VSRLLEGQTIGAEASLNKIFWSEMDLRMHETALRLLGDRAELLPAAPDAVDGAKWLDGYLFSLAGPIYAGTNEIQRNVIADRVLNLPRTR
jgi:alkylation response protein AidB-like acyl-CoA dehydrogenase